MANIQNYNPPSPPSFNVGTAGANYAPGNMFRALASDVDKVRDQFGQAKTGRTMALLGPLSNALGTAGQIFHRDIANHFARQAQITTALTQHLGAAQVSNTMYSFNDFANNKAEQLKQKYPNDPQTAKSEFKDALADAAEHGRDQLLHQFPSNTNFAIQFNNDANSARTTWQKDMSSWALSQSTKNVHDTIDNARITAVQSIADAEGSGTDKALNFINQKRNFEQLTERQTAPFGQPYVDKQKNAFQLHASEAYFSNALSSPPDKPEARFQYLDDVASQLKDSAAIGFTLTPEKKKQFDSLVDSLRGQYSRDMVNHLEYVQNPQAESKARMYTANIEQNQFNAPLQNQFINFANEQIKGLQAKNGQVQNNPLYPPEVKKAFYENIGKQIGRYTSGIDKAQAHLNHIDTMNRMDTRAVTAAEKAEAKKEEMAQKAQSKSQQLAAQTDLNRSAEALGTLALSSVKDAKSAQQLMVDGKVLHDKINEYEDKGILTPSKANSLRNHVDNISENSFNWQQQAPPMWGLLGTNGPVKKQAFSKSLDAKLNMANKIGASGQALLDQVKQDRENDAFFNGNQEAVSTYNAAADKIRQRAQQEKWLPVQLNEKLNGLRPLIAAKFQAAAAAASKMPAKPSEHASKQDASKATAHKPAHDSFIPPPPPMTPAVVPGGKMTRAQAAAMLGVQITD